MLTAALAVCLSPAVNCAAQQGGLSVDAGYLMQVRTALAMANQYERDQQLDSAEAAYREAVETAERLDERDVPLALLWRASFLRRHDRLPEARVDAERALKLFLETLGPDDLGTAVAYGALGSMEHSARDYEKAEPHLRAVLDAYRRDPRPEREPEVWIAAWNLALEFKERGQLPETEQLLRFALELKNRLLPRDSWWIARIDQELAINRGAQGDVDEAVRFYEEAATSADALGDAGILLQAAVLTGQAVSLRQWGRREAAQSAGARALPALRRTPRPDWVSIGNLSMILINDALARGDRAELDKYSQALLDDFDEEPARVKTSYAALAAYRLAESLRLARRHAEAEAMARRSVAILSREAVPDWRTLSRAHELLGLALFGQNKVAEGAAELRLAIGYQEQVAGAPVADRINLYEWLGDSYFDAGHYRESEQPLREALDLATTADEPVTLSRVQVRLSTTYRYLGRYVEAEALARQALALRREKMPYNDSLMADALFDLAASLRWQRKYADAEPLFRDALQLREKAHGSDHPLVMADKNGLALTLDGLGRHAEAETLFRQALAGRERSLGPEHADVADVLVGLGGNLRRQGRNAEAAEIAERPLAIYRKALGADHPSVVRALVPLATIRRERGEFEEANRLLQDALRIRVLAYGADDLSVADIYGELVALASASRQFEEGARYAEKMLAIAEASFGDEDPRLMPALGSVGHLMLLAGKVDAAESTFKRALAISERHFGMDSAEVGFASLDMAYVFQVRGKFGDVEAYFERPLAIFEKTLGPSHPAVASALLWRALYQTAIGQAKEAEASYDRALSIVSAANGEGSPALAGILNNKALLLVQLSRWAEAQGLLERAIELQRQGSGRESPVLASSMVNLALLYGQAGRHAEAEKLMREAVDIYGRLFGANRMPQLIMAPQLAPPPQDI